MIYTSSGQSFDIEDRALAHLRVVFMNKLRRAEPFMFHVAIGDGSGSRTVWIHPAIAIVFHFYGSRPPAMNRHWIDALMHEASSSHGLTLLPEPEAGEKEPSR
nr:ATP-dependent DNA ligase [Microbacterium endophyticum]